MPTTRRCAECGKLLSDDVPDGSCPACVLRGALALSEEASEAADAENTGDHIGRYRLLKKIGEGGCGIVYLAEQTEPIRRQVALKVIKFGLDTKQVIARFEAERQALALMDHPHIARVLDAGATDMGRPYFVMELVDGIRITDFCDQHNLSTHQRLDLFIQVCGAVQHAHQKGIIHRDIKPSNILVIRSDGVSIPKVIDFGIAKATREPLTEKTLVTAFHQFIGTLAYMSPEQAGMDGQDIDTRSDIYTLGVLLYELLTGHLPFESDELRQAGFDEMRRIIREQEPPKPSTRLTQELNSKSEIRNPKSEMDSALRTPHSAIPSDLDWIVMKCLEKDRARRYETASGLADDVSRHLNHEPVVARPPGNLYRFQKFIRRNKVAFSFLTTIAVALALGIVVSSCQALRATRAERTQARLRRQAEAAEKTAIIEKTNSQQVAKFLTDMLAGVGPSVAQGRDTKLLREILDRTLERVRKDLREQPEVAAELLNVIGDVYMQLSDYTKAEALRREALTLRKNVFGNEHRKVADSLNNLANVFYRQSKLAEAENTHRDALAMRRKLLGNEHSDVADSLNNLGNVLWGQGNLPEAESLFREALAIRRKSFGHKHPDVSQSLANLAAVLSLRNKLSEAEAMQREVLDMDRSLVGNNHPDVAFDLNNLADMLCTEGKYSEAESIGREALELRKKLLGNEHADVANSLFLLANILLAKGDLGGAETIHREALAMRRKILAPEHLDIASSLNNLASVLIQEGKLDEAETLQREALAIQEKSLGPDHQDITGSFCNLAAVLREEGKFAEAATFYRRAADQGMAEAQSSLAAMYARGQGITKDATEATKWYRKAAEQFRKDADGGDVKAQTSLAWILATCSIPELRDGRSAVSYAEKAAAVTERKDPAVLGVLAAAYAEAGQFEKAISIQKEAIELFLDEKTKKEHASRLKLYESNSPFHESD